MINQALSYSDHFETIVALVTYLAVCEIDDNAQEKRDNVTVGEVAERLDLNKSEVELVLKGYKGLFRKSEEDYPTKNHGKQYRYSLLLRYAQRPYIDGRPESWGPRLTNKELFSLLGFIANKVREEQENERIRTREMEESKRQRITNLITLLGIAATLALSLAALIINLLK